MHKHPRLFLSLRILVSGIVLAATAAHAFPDKTITILMPFAPGSSTDVIAREFGQAVSGVVRQPVMVDNKVGAEGLIAGQALVNSQGDGHTMLFTSSSLPVLDPLMRKNLLYDAVKGFAPVCSVARITNVMHVSGGSRWKTVADVIGAAKAQPGKLAFAYTSATTRLAGDCSSRPRARS